MFRASLLVVIGLLTLPVNADEVAKRYNKNCAICHATGMAGAPITHDSASWGARATKEMNELVKSVVEGKGAMPPTGMCKDCTNEDYKALVEYMLPQD